MTGRQNKYIHTSTLYTLPTTENGVTEVNSNTCTHQTLQALPCPLHNAKNIDTAQYRMLLDCCKELSV